MSSENLHEPIEQLPSDLLDRHRAIVSIMEELEAVDWYDQRVAGATDPELADVLAHNRDEEKEHAAMVIEWLRRNDAVFDRHLRTYLFTEGSIRGIEAVVEHGSTGDGAGSPAVPDPGDPDDGSLGIGGLSGAENT